jgi:hypothetical protein
MATITTRGKYYPERRMATLVEPPVHLRITAKTKEAVENAVKKVRELLTQQLNIDFRGVSGSMG